MKKALILLSILASVLCASARSLHSPNVELIGSWQYETTYLTGNNPCYIKTENYLFYSDQTCTVQTRLVHCETEQPTQYIRQLRWVMADNHILLLNADGRLEQYFTLKSHNPSILIGQRTIRDTKDLTSIDPGKIYAELTE